YTSLTCLSTHLLLSRTHTLSLHDALPIYYQPAGLYGIVTFHHSDRCIHESQSILGCNDLCQILVCFSVECISQPFKHYRINDFRSEEHTSELQSRFDIVCRLLLEKKKMNI